MLELNHIRKTYKIGDIETQALDDINVAFREKEFVAILGASGSGKTTCLNIIGGLDRYDSGEMTIKGKKTKDFKDKDWDAYRNNSIGFVFQCYNLISHLSIVANVELSMTLSGVSSCEKRKRAIDVLERVGLKAHLHKKPNQLSGGQMQRVAIARALVNNPEILLCDEPTGALDTVTSIQILELIKEISRDRLVIMVTHNPELAQNYADRIIQFQDGNIISDTHPYEEHPEDYEFKLKKTSMSFITALKLSYNNIRTKKGRTFLTAFASSIGIIGIAIILSLSTGFQLQIDKFQSDAMSEFPIIISQSTSKLNSENYDSLHESMKVKRVGTGEYTDSDEGYIYDPSKTTLAHTNIFTEEYMEYLNKIDPDICSSIGYARIVGMNVLRDVNGTIKPVTFTNLISSMSKGMSMTSMNSMYGFGMSSFPNQLKKGEESYLVKNYELISGKYPESTTDLVLVIDAKNRLDLKTLEALGFDVKDQKSIKYNNIVGTEFKIISNNDYYVETAFGTFLPGEDYDEMYASNKNITVKLVGVVRKKKEVNIGLLKNGIVYSDKLSQLVIDNAINSDIVKAQEQSDKNIITMEDMEEEIKSTFLSYLGGNATPFMVMVYPDNFEDKDAVTAYLDAYNRGKEIDNQIIYTDLAETMSKMTSGIMDGIALVLIAFAAVSLVVSLIMISIITYTSVLERTKEIGILKALGARKKDITRVFDAETCILGIFSGVLGIAIAMLCIIPINNIIFRVSELKNVAQLQLIHAIALIILSTALTMLGGHIPARMASRKDAVEALRSE